MGFLLGILKNAVTSYRQNLGKGVALLCVNDKLSIDMITIPVIEPKHMTA